MAFCITTHKIMRTRKTDTAHLSNGALYLIRAEFWQNQNSGGR
jgi:hypothetical protein